MTLTIERLTVLRGNHAVIADLSLVVQPGEALLLKGRNGSGKTTLLRTIAGFLRPSAGRIDLEASDSGADAEATVAERCHFVGHQNAVKPSLTVLENAQFWGRFLAPEAPTDESLRQALDRLGLGGLADVPAAFLSAGQRRRLCLTRLVVVHRPLWLLDEPTVSLDSEATRALAGLIAEHIADGGLVLAATHINLGLAAAREYRLDGLAEAA